MNITKSQSLKRALDILFAIAEEGKTMTTPEIAAKVSIPESTVYRLLQTLEENGVVERKSRGRVSLGLRILELARSLSQQMDQGLTDVARPIMKELTAATEETTALMIRSDLNAICVENVESDQLLRLAMENGKTLPLNEGASGKAILAFESTDIIERVVGCMESDERKKQLIKELAQIRRQGYSITVGEADPGIVGIAAPIFNHSGDIIASLTVAGPKDRVDASSQSLIRMVLEAANDISDHLLN